MGALSRDWTVQRFMDHALIEFGGAVDKNSPAYVQRHEIVNQTQSTTVNIFYDLVSNSYLTEITILPDTTGRYTSAGAGTWTAATKTLTFVGMNTDFGSGDVGKTIVFRVGALVYIGQVTAYVSGDAVKVDGHNLPSTDQVVDYVMLSSSTPTGNNISLVGLRLMRTAVTKMVLESTETETVNAISEDEIRTWQTNGPKNKKTIVWSLVGDQINLRKGDDLTTYGTFTLYYPRVPINVTADTDYLDIPDGALVDIALIKAQTMIARRTPGVGILDKSAELGLLIQSLYRSAGREIGLELLKDKILALQ